MEFQSLNELFQERVQRYADKEAYRYKKDGRWVSVNWRDYGSRVRSLALSLVEKANRRATSMLLSYSQQFREHLDSLTGGEKMRLSDFAYEVLRALGL